MDILILFLIAFIPNLLFFFYIKLIFRIIEPDLFPRLFITDLIISSLYYWIIIIFFTLAMYSMDPGQSPLHLGHLFYIIPVLYNILKYYFLIKKYTKLKIKKLYLFIEFILLAVGSYFIILPFFSFVFNLILNLELISFIFIY